MVDAARIGSQGDSLTTFQCDGSGGPVALSFGRPPPEGLRCKWRPRSSPFCQAPINITAGLAIRFQLGDRSFVAWTLVDDSVCQSEQTISWVISKFCDNYLSPESWEVPPAVGPGPENAITRLLGITGRSRSNFRQRERLGFNNVLFLAQLERAFRGGSLPNNWTPPSTALLQNGRLSRSDLAQLGNVDVNIRHSLAHLLPPCLHAQGQIGHGMGRPALTELDPNLYPLIPPPTCFSTPRLVYPEYLAQRRHSVNTTHSTSHQNAFAQYWDAPSTVDRGNPNTVPESPFPSCQINMNSLANQTPGAQYPTLSSTPTLLQPTPFPAQPVSMQHESP